MVAMGTVEKKLTYRNRKGFNDVKKYVKTVNPNLPGQSDQKAHFKEAVEDWREGGYSIEDIKAWNLYARANRIRASGFNMFTRYYIGAKVDNKDWEGLSDCTIYDVIGTGFKVDINVNADHSGKLYYGTLKLYMVNEVAGVFSVDKYTFEITGLSLLTNYYFYIKNTAIGKEGRTGIYSKKTTEFTPVTIDIGNEAKNRSQSMSSGQTRIDINHLATGTGKINLIEIWAYTDMTGVEVATFFKVSGNNYSTRDTHNIGNVISGSKKSFIVDLNVNKGDAIGIYWTGGRLENDPGGTALYLFGDQIPCTDKLFVTQAATFSIYGTGKGVI